MRDYCEFSGRVRFDHFDYVMRQHFQTESNSENGRLNREPNYFYIQASKILNNDSLKCLRILGFFSISVMNASNFSRTMRATECCGGIFGRKCL